MKTYDLVVVGSGTGAQAASSQMRAAGWSVALVDHRPFGGTCALRGCDPKRVLMSGGEAIDAQTRMRGHGVTGEARIDWRDLMMFKRSFTDAVLLRHGEQPLARAILQRVGSRAVPGLGQKLLNRMELSNRSPGCIELPEGDRAMNPPDEFLKHADDCEQMAKFARDAESKATWNRMAERWRRCAEKFTTESLAAHHAMLAKRRQGVAPDWAHH